MKDALDAMAQRFLSWPLPVDVCADAVACQQGAPHRTGTTLLTHAQARQMIEYVCASELATLRARVAELERAKDDLDYLCVRAQVALDELTAGLRSVRIAQANDAAMKKYNET